jgi:hypothetical protein
VFFSIVTRRRGTDQTMLDHVGFAVRDYPRSSAFYGKALAPLGFPVDSS